MIRRKEFEKKEGMKGMRNFKKLSQTMIEKKWLKKGGKL